MSLQDLSNLNPHLTAEIEPLHPDLARCIRHSPIPVLSHWLIHQPFYTPFQNKWINAAYVHKMARYAEFLAAKEWPRLMFLVERPYRFDAFRKHMDQMSDAEYWENLGWVYRDSENIQESPFIPALLRSSRAGREHLMDEDSAKVFADLPDEITVYKGFKADYHWSEDFSFSLSKSTAEWFAHRFNPKGPRLLVATVSKADVIGYMDQRGESEILADPERVLPGEITLLRAKGQAHRAPGLVHQFVNETGAERSA